MHAFTLHPEMTGVSVTTTNALGAELPGCERVRRPSQPIIIREKNPIKTGAFEKLNDRRW